MKLYFSTRQIPQLKGLTLTQRLNRLNEASSKLSVPEKSFLNVLNLLLIVATFVLIMRMTQDWSSLLWAILVVLFYPLLVKPIQYSLCVKYLKESE